MNRTVYWRIDRQTNRGNNSVINNCRTGLLLIFKYKIPWLYHDVSNFPYPCTDPYITFTSKLGITLKAPGKRGGGREGFFPIRVAPMRWEVTSVHWLSSFALIQNRCIFWTLPLANNSHILTFHFLFLFPLLFPYLRKSCFLIVATLYFDRK